MKIVFASENTGKIQELQTLLAERGISIIPQADFGVPSIAETQPTFIENALLKARHAAMHTKLPAIADDSGLNVDALAGAPGIYSARYAGEKCSANDNIKKLLTLMQPIPEGKRTARFYCALVYLKSPDDPTPLICEGEWAGTILSTPQGHGGFGYDPIFYDADLKMSAAECSIGIKNKISHRGKALRLLVEKLQCMR